MSEEVEASDGESATGLPRWHDDTGGLTPTGDSWATPLESNIDSESPPEPTSIVSGFWRRTLAFTLDSVFLGLVGAALGFALFDVFANLGGWGRLIGFAVSLIYFATLDSSFGRGQTLGKRIMRVRVVNRAGDSIGPGKAALRYTVLATPIFLNGLMIPVSVTTGVVGYVIGVAIVGLGAVAIYLYLFNRRTRQSTHDLAAGTFVTKANSTGPITVRTWGVHIVVAVVLMVMAVGGTAWAMMSAQKLPPGLLQSVKAIEATGKTHTASVFIGKSWGSSGTSTYVTVNAVLKKPPSTDDSVAKQLAAIVLREFPDANNVDEISVRTTRGFDIGIASGSKSRTESRSPREWQDALP